MKSPNLSSRIPIQNASGDLDKYRYLFVQLEYYPKTVIILEDNRQEYGHNANQPSTAMLTPIV